VNSFASFFQVGISTLISLVAYLKLSTWMQKVHIPHLRRYRHGIRPATKPCTSAMFGASKHQEDRQQYLQSEESIGSWFLFGYQPRW
jgi:hypothetical protein